MAIYERLELNKLRTTEFLELFDRPLVAVPLRCRCVVGSTMGSTQQPLVIAVGWVLCGSQGYRPRLGSGWESGLSLCLCPFKGLVQPNGRQLPIIGVLRFDLGGLMVR